MGEEEKYEVLEKIGHGSFGVIRKVRRKSDGHVLCRKEINYVKMSQKEREQLQAELSILKELRHPNIVAYYEREHLKASMDLHLYMEYCGNGDLGQVIQGLKAKNQYAEEEFVWSIFAQLVTALYRCHYGENPPEVGRNVMGLGNNAKPLKSKQATYMILHRDLKPENVFLGADNSVKLGDFGLSKILHSHDFASTYVGTPFYMSPEICAAERYTLYSDIWSLGCLIFELCAKEPPFNAKTHFDLIQKIKLGRVPAIPDVYSAELQKVINSCLRVNPNTRPDTAQLLNLPMIKLMRKEQEVVHLAHQLKAEKEIATRALQDANERIKALESAGDTIRVEIDSTVRREWEVKARLEIDRQVQMELEKLRQTYEGEVSRRVAEQLAKVVASTDDAPSLLLSSPALVQTQNPADVPMASGTPYGKDVPCQSSFSTVNSSSDFPSGTDLSSVNMETPELEKSHDNGTDAKEAKPTKRPARTPFTRAKTFAAPVASPMDVHMADPSPMSIASLSLSPRRNEMGRQQNSDAPRRNIFAAAERWHPHNMDSLPCYSSDEDEPEGGPVYENDCPDSPTIVKKTAARMPANDNNTFRRPNRRPGLPTRKTAFQYGQVPAARNTLFPVGGEADHDHHSAAKARSRAMVPVVTTSPVRRKFAAAGGGVGAESPTRRAPAAPGSNVKGGRKSSEEDAGGHGSRGNIQGRTLVELAQGRVAGAEKGAAADAEKRNSGGTAKIVEREREVVWDPERDEMPSPFLIRGKQERRAPGGAR